MSAGDWVLVATITIVGCAMVIGAIVIATRFGDKFK